MAAEHKYDVVDLLTEQHQEIKKLFEQVEKGSGERRAEKFDALRRLLSVHETAEEQVLHPYARGRFGGGGAVEELLQEEKNAKAMLSALDDVDTGSPEFLPKLRELREAVVAHAEQEESREFAQIRIKGTREELEGMVRLVKAAEAVAPTRPHPGVESQKKHLLFGPTAAFADRVRDAIAAARS